MKLADIGRLRLRNQRVAGGKLKTARDVVSWLGAVQSQEYPYAKWSLGMRATGLSDASVDGSLRDGEIIRTHIMRPTWHFVAPADLRWMMALTGPRVARTLRSTAALRIPEEAVVLKAFEAIAAELQGGRRLSRAAIVDLLTERRIIGDKVWAIPIFIRAELELLLCSGGLDGKQQTYALVDERVAPAPEPFDRDWALAELSLRYFTSHGPATVHDFSWWSGLTVTDARRGIAANGSALHEVEADDGLKYWWAGELRGPDEPSPTAHFMQGYDEYIVAYRPPRDAINLARYLSPNALSAPPYLHAIVLDSQGVGFWRRVAEKDGFAVDIRFARPITATESAAVMAALERYRAFLGQEIRLRS